MDVSISIIDYIGEIGGGVGILLSMKVINSIYEIIYWFDIQGNIKLIPDEQLLKLLNVKDIYDYENIDDLVDKIENVLPDKIEILKEFKII